MDETQSCTDQSWRSESCTTICRIDNLSWGIEIYPCPNQSDSSKRWYCGGGSNVDRCTSSTPNSTFSLPQGFFSDFRDYRCIATASNAISCSIQSLTTPKSAYSSTISTSTPTTTISTANCPSPTPSLLFQACQSSSALPAGPVSANPTSTQVGISAGVGVPLLVALVASLSFLFRERRLRKQLAIEYGVSNNERGHHFPSSNLHRTWFSTRPKIPTSPVFEVEAGPVPTRTPIEIATNSRGGRS